MTPKHSRGGLGNLARNLALGTAVTIGSAGLAAELSGCTAQRVYYPAKRAYAVPDLPKGLSTGSDWIDRNQDRRITRNEILNLGKHTFRSGEQVMLFGHISPPYGSAQIILYDEEDNEIASTGLVNPSSTQNVLRHYFTLKSVFKKTRATAKLYVNGREVSRDTIDFIP